MFHSAAKINETSAYALQNFVPSVQQMLHATNVENNVEIISASEMLSFHRGKNSPREKGWRGVRSGRTGLFFFPFQFGRILAILSLEAGREIARRAEANLITKVSHLQINRT